MNANNPEDEELEIEMSSENDSATVIEEIQVDSSATVIVGIDENVGSRKEVEQVELRTSETLEKEVVEII